MIIQSKHFHDSLNIVLTIAPSHEFFSFKCVQFFNIYGMRVNRGHSSSRTVIIHFSDKPYQEKNLKSHLIVYYFVNKEKYCQIGTCTSWFVFNLLTCAYFCYKIEKFHLQKWLKYFSILRPKKMIVRFEYVPWKNVCLILLHFHCVWVHFFHKMEKFKFWRSLKYFFSY